MSKRKSFLIYIDSLPVLDDLNDEQAGRLFKAISAYHNDVDLELDSLTKIAFSPFKSQFARDEEKYQKIVERNKNNGLKGGRPKTEDNQEEAKQPSGLFGNPSNPNKADSVSVSVSVSDIKPTVEAKPQRSKFKFNDDQMNFASAVYQKVKEVTPAMKEPNLESWANTARLMEESNNFKLIDVWNAFCWANEDNFWRVNILSVDKLREKYPILEAKMKGETSGFNGKQQKARPKVKEFKL